MKKEPVKVSVLFATYNGGKKLARMLEALTHQTLPQSDWKIIAVNNNSTDDTQSILESYLGRLPLEIYFEKKQGKAEALNLAFQYIEGDLVILTDDDVIPNPDWIDQYIKLAADHPDFDIFGGLILPAWDKEPDQWILDWVRLSAVYALNHEFQEGEVPGFFIMGPNSAFRRSILGPAYIVNDYLGPKANVVQYAMGEDSLFVQNLERKGHRIFQSKLPVVQHIIPEAYLDEKWIISRAERYGLGFPLIRTETLEKGFFVGGYSLKMLVKFFLMSIVVSIVRQLPRSRFRYDFLWGYNFRKGVLRTMRMVYLQKGNDLP